MPVVPARRAAEPHSDSTSTIRLLGLVSCCQHNILRTLGGALLSVDPPFAHEHAHTC
jgi:hypothetical protein